MRFGLRGLWKEFHNAWAWDSDPKNQSESKYDKAAWMYVQDRMEKYLEEQHARALQVAKAKSPK